ncbi:MAG: hypothetical protein EBR79_01095 [Proteobacteria bacterium]|nr:hypothetical protein [Pseudomonadota bacterium]
MHSKNMLKKTENYFSLKPQKRVCLFQFHSQMGWIRLSTQILQLVRLLCLMSPLAMILMLRGFQGNLKVHPKI